MVPSARGLKARKLPPLLLLVSLHSSGNTGAGHLCTWLHTLPQLLPTLHRQEMLNRLHTPPTCTWPCMLFPCASLIASSQAGMLPDVLPVRWPSIQINHEPFGLTNFAMALLLVFRTNSR